MNRRIFKIIIPILLSFIFAQSVCAFVYTEKSPKEFNKDMIYISGNPDLYTIEYYNRHTKEFEGVIPNIFKKISERTGIEFTYIREPDYKRKQAYEKDVCHIISSFVTGSSKDFTYDSSKMFSYEIDGKNADIGIAFAKSCPVELANLIKKEIASFSEGEINGLLLATEAINPNDRDMTRDTLTFVCFLLLLIVGFALFKLENMRKRMEANKLLDPDTKIGNLSFFEGCFHSRIPENKRENYYFLYIIIDSNYLSVYHSGISFADSVKYVANSLHSFAGQGEFAARITENGFAFAFMAENTKAAGKRANEIIKSLNMFLNADKEFQKPYFYAALYNLDSSDRNSGFLLFNLRKFCSDLIKSNKQFAVCDNQSMNSALEEKLLIEKIEEGFLNNEFKMYMQFIVKNKTGELVSAEALSRWEPENKEIIPPLKYIGAMEKSGLISRLDYYMFEMACRQLHKWRDTELDKITLSCNFTRITISEKDFVAKLKEISGKYVFDKTKLLIEITEDAIEKNQNIAIINMLNVKKMGFRIALDDMGSGYTSLQNLCEYPIDVVKIDRNILLKADENNGKELFAGIISLAHKLKLTVVCEGVETKEQNEFVESTDCDYIQGWYYTKALCEEDAIRFAKEYMNKNQKENGHANA